MRFDQIASPKSDNKYFKIKVNDANCPLLLPLQSTAAASSENYYTSPFRFTAVHQHQYVFKQS